MLRTKNRHRQLRLMKQTHWIDWPRNWSILRCWCWLWIACFIVNHFSMLCFEIFISHFLISYGTILSQLCFYFIGNFSYTYLLYIFYFFNRFENSSQRKCFLIGNNSNLRNFFSYEDYLWNNPKCTTIKSTKVPILKYMKP